MGKSLMTLIMVAILLLVGLSYVFAAPEGADISRHASSRHPNATVKTMSGGLGALAGNVTYVNITASAVTRTWMGYYGNVSGTLVLQTSDGNNLYSWSMASPGGKVLASNSTISDWTDVFCWNTSALGAQGLTPAEWNTKYGATSGDYDNITNTFSGSYAYTTFYVGSKEFTAASTNDGSIYLCPAVQLYNESGAKGATQYEEIILQRTTWGASNNDPPLIYVSILEATGTGFNGEQVDFEMMVPDDGHGSDTTVSTYYFYVELESS